MERVFQFLLDSEDPSDPSDPGKSLPNSFTPTRHELNNHIRSHPQVSPQVKRQDTSASVIR